MLMLVLVAVVYGVHAGDTNVPLLEWDTKVDQSGVWAYHVTVSKGPTCGAETVVWDTGLVWQENEPFSGACHYAGPPLEKDTLYTWCCWETQLRSASGG